MAEYITYPRSEWPDTYYRAFFLYDTDHPQSLYASVVSATSEGPENDYNNEFTYVVDCPSTTCSTDFPQQTITHIGGSSWQGRVTAGGKTTSWACDLGGDEDHPHGTCAATTASDLSITTLPLTSTVDNGCFAIERSVVVYMTAGMSKWYEAQDYYEPGQGGPEGLMHLLSDAYSSACPAKTTTTGGKTETTVTTAEATETESSESSAAARTGESTGEKTASRTVSEEENVSQTGSAAAGEPTDGGSVGLSFSKVLLTALLSSAFVVSMF